ncbi:KamA family radical SAM protein [Patescibacteria group bacterium]|nr:KamA family radical SAM protein [Patescibacteria group bacterium]
MLHARLSPHLKKLAKTCPAIYRQFVPSCEEVALGSLTIADPLLEDAHTVIPGLIYKYGNRALVLLTLNCAAYCRFCTRRRKVSDIEKGIITSKDLDRIVVYIEQHPDIKELIISGGDPLTVPSLLKKALQKFTRLPQIKIIRIGSRLPVANPRLVNQAVLSALKVVRRQPLYLMLHFEHPAEITKATIQAVRRLQSVATMLLSQSVFLRGVNDNPDILYELFSSLIEIGVKPYYIYRCDLVQGIEHFVVPLEKEIQIMTELRTRLSGLASPTYVIDTPNGTGKIPVPLNFWQFNKESFVDFLGNRIINFPNQEEFKTVNMNFVQMIEPKIPVNFGDTKRDKMC